MPVNLTAPDAASLLPVAGVELGTARAGIRKPGRRDLLVVRLAEGTHVAGVFTRNRFCAAPVVVSRQHLAASQGQMRALVVNTGVANAGTGAEGQRNAQQVCQAVAAALGVPADTVLPMSTGVILEHLPVERIAAGVPDAVADLAPTHWVEAAEAIMTTDTLPKAVSRRVKLPGGEVVMTGISKGAGMIRPNMATMLGMIATDARIAPDLLQTWVRRVADASFNRITVDGDTSTNDTFLLLSTGQGAVSIAHDADPGAAELLQALVETAVQLAQSIVRPSSSPSRWKGPAMTTRLRPWPTPLPILRWSRRPFSRPIPTWGASWQPSAMLASMTWTWPGWKCGWTTCAWPARGGAIRTTGKKTASAC